MSRRSAARIMSVLLWLWCGGCAPAEQIPTYPLMGPQQTLRRLSQRASEVHAVSGQGNLRLIRENGDGVLLDAAIAILPADRARVRAWKFGSAVFDLTILPDGVYLYAPE